MSAFSFAASGTPALPLYLVQKAGLDALLASFQDDARNWAEAAGFRGGLGEVLLLPGPNGEVSGALGGLGGDQDAQRKRFAVALLRPKLPEGSWVLETDMRGDALEEAALGWLLAAYRYDRYAEAPSPAAQLVAPEGVDRKRLEQIAAGEALARDLINTPASDMGPAALENAAHELSSEFGAQIAVIKGEALLESNFPMIHAVGRAAAEPPRLIEINWGNTGPKLTLVGKGVCFDTGGLNLKSGASMGLMKKDMGGAANVLGLARMLMASEAPFQLRILIPAVENSVSANSFRPSDILTSRKGLTVEINNTDAEGRLVLADALTLAAEGSPDLIISMATLTGAARVAVGPDLAPFYTDNDADAAHLAEAANAVRDPVWRMPFHTPYEAMIEPGIADLDNAPSGGFAGSITAALFLKRFVAASPRYAHFDIYGWQPKPAPGRAKGGVGQGTRAVLAALPGLLGI